MIIRRYQLHKDKPTKVVAGFMLRVEYVEQDKDGNCFAHISCLEQPHLIGNYSGTPHKLYLYWHGADEEILPGGQCRGTVYMDGKPRHLFSNSKEHKQNGEDIQEFTTKVKKKKKIKFVRQLKPLTKKKKFKKKVKRK